MGCSASSALEVDDGDGAEDVGSRRTKRKGVVGKRASLSLIEVERRVSMDAQSLRAAKLIESEESEEESEEEDEETPTHPAFRSESFVRKASLVTRQKSSLPDTDGVGGGEVAETHGLKSGKDVFGHRHVNQYVLVKDLGRGAYGVVKLALNTSNGGLYAMKMINLNQLKQNVSLVRTAGGRSERRYEDVDKVRREVALMKKLRHPNVVNLFEVIDDPEAGMLILVEEFVEGGPVLKDDEGVLLEEDMRRKVMRDLVTGLDYLHHNKVLHRDIKPENLLCTAEEPKQLKITDFGVSTFMEDHQGGGRGDGEWDLIATGLTGTPAYMAPECIGDGDTFSGVAADVWSCGMVLFHLTYGRPMFSRSNSTAVLQSIQNDPIAIPELSGAGDEVDEDLRDLLAHMLDRDPRTRYTLANAAAHPWMTEGGRYPLSLLSSSSQRVIVTDLEAADALRTEDRLSFKLRKASVRSFKVKRGEDLVKQGDLGTSMYLVQKGSLAVLVQNSSDDDSDEDSLPSPPRHVADRGVGAFIGEVAALGISKVRTATLRAMEDTEVMEVTPDELGDEDREDLHDVANSRVSSSRSLANDQFADPDSSWSPVSPKNVSFQLEE